MGFLSKFTKEIHWKSLKFQKKIHFFKISNFSRFFSISKKKVFFSKQIFKIQNLSKNPKIKLRKSYEHSKNVSNKKYTFSYTESRISIYYCIVLRTPTLNCVKMICMSLTRSIPGPGAPDGLVGHHPGRDLSHPVRSHGPHYPRGRYASCRTGSMDSGLSGG